MNQCPHCCQPAPAERRRGGFFSTLFSILLLYVVLVFGGGTLINTGHPVAVEAGRIMHLVTFVEPTIHWADRQGYQPVATTLRVLSHGVQIT